MEARSDPHLGLTAVLDVLSALCSGLVLTDSLHPDWMDIDTYSKSFYSDGQPLSDHIKALKERALRSALTNNSPVEELREYARTTNGLINNAIRTKVWSILLDVPDTSTHTHILDDLEAADLPPHRDEDQVRLDIQRSFNVISSLLADHSYTVMFLSAEIDRLKKSLLHLITRILRKFPLLNYYQGYHDVAGIVLLVTGNEDSARALAILERITLVHLRDFMVSDINLLVDHLRLIPALLEVADKELFAVVKLVNTAILYDYSFYPALSSILTQFSHDVQNLPHILVIWDFVFSYDSVAVNAYIYVAALMFYKDRIIDALGGDIEAADPDIVHTLVSPALLFSQLTDEHVVKILNKARHLIETVPLSDLPENTFSKWFGLYNKSLVLMNTSASSQADQKLRDTIADDVCQIIAAQESEIHRQMIDERAAQDKYLQQQEYYSEYDSSNNALLSSSLSITSNLTASFSSSELFKKLFKVDAVHDNKNVAKRSTKTSLFKISITVGVVGILLHYVLVKVCPNYYNMGTIKHALEPLWKLAHAGETLGEATVSLASDISTDVSTGLGEVYRHTVGSLAVHTGVHISQIGIGSLRSTVLGQT